MRSVAIAPPLQGMGRFFSAATRLNPTPTFEKHPVLSVKAIFTLLTVLGHQFPYSALHFCSQRKEGALWHSFSGGNRVLHHHSVP